MILSQFCPQQDRSNSFQLLKFSKISDSDNNVSTEMDEKSVVESLNGLSKSSITECRSFLPLIYRNVTKAELIGKLHPNVQTLIRENSLRLIAASINDQLWIQKTTDLFKKKSIPVILLKAAAFSNTLYPDNAPRIGVDIDILVRTDDFENGCALLNKIMKPVIQSSERLATHDTLFERTFQPRNSSSIIIEMHRGLTNPHIFNIDEQTLWNDSRPHPAYGSDQIRILSPEDTLLHLAVHAFRDLNFCNHNLLDTHEAWCQWKPEPNVLLKKATQWGATHVLYYLLENARKIMGTPIEKSLVEQIKPDRIRDEINKRILQSVSQQILSGKTYRFRLIQLISQLSFPDHPAQGVKYQAYYLRTRIKDRQTSK